MNSYGIIPLKKEGNSWKVLLVQHRQGHFAFPKGRPENGETPLQTAKRELFEETHLRVKRLLLEEPLTEQYTFTYEGTVIHKSVSYFVAEVTGDVKIQEEELNCFEWLSFGEAVQKITFREARSLLQQVIFSL